jgi:hypothetical protein
MKRYADIAPYVALNWADRTFERCLGDGSLCANAATLGARIEHFRASLEESSALA